MVMAELIVIGNGWKCELAYVVGLVVDGRSGQHYFCRKLPETVNNHGIKTVYCDEKVLFNVQ